MNGKPIVIPTPIDTRGYPVVTQAKIVFTQDTPADVWTIQHNFGRIPGLTVVDLSGNIVFIGYAQGITNAYGTAILTDTSVTITFSNPMAGKALLS